MYSIAIDRARLLVDMRLSGFFTPEIAADATQALRAAVRSLGADMGRHVTLYDATDLQVSPAETVAYIAASYAEPEIRPLWARRVAYCTPSALARMQVARLRSGRSDIAVHASREDALAWLLEDAA
ncbi:MAG: hypothetical protein V4537_01540 [Pseudomonadota bacterium]